MKKNFFKEVRGLHFGELPTPKNPVETENKNEQDSVLNNKEKEEEFTFFKSSRHRNHDDEHVIFPT